MRDAHTVIAVIAITPSPCARVFKCAVRRDHRGKVRTSSRAENKKYAAVSPAPSRKGRLLHDTLLLFPCPGLDKGQACLFIE